MGVFVIKNVNQLPQFRFEWHPGKKRVYVIRIGMVPEVGEPIACDVENEGAAMNAVLVWCRGYKQGRADTTAVSERGVICA